MNENINQFRQLIKDGNFSVQTVQLSLKIIETAPIVISL